ncbi:hypothetical protein [Intrasporangium mesophilum]
MPLEDLPALLSKELVPARPSGVRVTAVDAQGGVDLVLRFLIEVDAGSPAVTQVWRLAMEIPSGDLTLLDGYSFILTLRANLEEWWHTGQGEMAGLEAVRLR